jgi:hypothetical protein
MGRPFKPRYPGDPRPLVGQFKNLKDANTLFGVFSLILSGR